MHKTLSYLVFCVLFIHVFTIVNARTPPKEAIDACKNVSSGDQCAFKTPHGRITGVCRNPPNQSQLACIPSRGNQNRGDNPALQSDNQNQRPNTRQHTINQSSGIIEAVPATTHPSIKSNLDISLQGDTRVLRANGIPQHDIGVFPNSGNPHRIQEQNYVYKINAKPTPNNFFAPLGMHNFGLAVNGVPFDPGAAEWYLGNRNSEWQYEPMSGAIRLGLDENHAHVQPSGAYHYHGIPTLLLDSLDVNGSSHSPLIGWAADGFPIYAIYGYENPQDIDSKVIKMTSSYSLRTGNRPSGAGNPGGKFDGTFINDYVYVEGAGILDMCNGRMTATPDFPEGTYAYYISEFWPIIPRCYKGTPSKDFTHQRAR